MSTVISKRKLPRFTDQTLSTSVELVTEKITLSSKAVAEAQRNIDINKERGMDLKQILEQVSYVLIYDKWKFLFYQDHNFLVVVQD